MKKLFVTLACLATLSFSSNAQIKITPVVGLNIANLGGDAEGTSSKMGAHLGALVGFGLGDHISVQPGLLYSMKGAKQELLGQDISMKLSYLEVPINLVYATGEEGSGRFLINAGPYLGFLMSAKVEDVDIKEGMKSLDYGLNVGVGYQLPMGLMVRAQYGLGLANINDDGSDAKITNNVIGISLGYTLGGRR